MLKLYKKLTKESAMSGVDGSWDVERIYRNANILYRYVGEHNVYVDVEGDLQVDHRSLMGRLVNCERVDTSRSKICEVSIRVLKKVLNGIETGEINERMIALRLDAEGDSWVNRRQFGIAICNKYYFKTLIPIDMDRKILDEELSEDQLTCRKILSLTKMLINGVSDSE